MSDFWKAVDKASEEVGAWPAWKRGVQMTNNDKFTKDELDALKTQREDYLLGLGMRPWDESGLWLFPADWVSRIPDGYLVTDIFGEEMKFDLGTADDDHRFGVLAYGVVVGPREESE